MKKLLGFISIVALVGSISCTHITVNPTTTIFLADTVTVDPDIEKFANFLTATWRCDKTSFTSTNDWIDNASIDCAKEKQFAFLKEMKVTRISKSSDLKVENTYICSPPQTTYFHLEKMACCGFTITEKNSLNQIIRVMDFIDPNGISIWHDFLLEEKGNLQITLFIRTFDPTTIQLSNTGSITAIPPIYMMYVEKNF